MTRERIGRFCIILGGLCILAAAFLLGFNLREERRAAAATQKILPAVAHSIGQSPAPMPTLPAGELTVSLEGEEYLGILSLPTLALELPVGAEWEMDFLRQAPCRYAGTLAGNDIIMAAHNYRRHFAALHTLPAIRWTGWRPCRRPPWRKCGLGSGILPCLPAPTMAVPE